MSQNEKARTQGASLFPVHYAILDFVAEQLGLQGNTFSATVQYVLVDWARCRRVNLADFTIKLPPASLTEGFVPISIGYLGLNDLTLSLDTSHPVYVAPHIETIPGPVPAQRIDQHYIVVTQPDVLNRVHYCRIAVVKLVYHNGIAFAPDADEQLAQVEQKHGVIEQWLVGEGFQVRAGMVGLPEDVVLIEGTF